MMLLEGTCKIRDVPHHIRYLGHPPVKESQHEDKQEQGHDETGLKLLPPPLLYEQGCERNRIQLCPDGNEQGQKPCRPHKPVLRAGRTAKAECGASRKKNDVATHQGIQEWSRATEGCCGNKLLSFFSFYRIKAKQAERNNGKKVEQQRDIASPVGIGERLPVAGEQILREH